MEQHLCHSLDHIALPVNLHFVGIFKHHCKWYIQMMQITDLFLTKELEYHCKLGIFCSALNVVDSIQSRHR